MPDVGEHLELEPQLAALAGLARLGAARRPVVGRREVDVAAPALAPFGHDHALAALGDVESELAACSASKHLRAHRHAHLEVLAAAPVAVFALAVLAAFGA